jgi:anti-sigma regulatory factor (Ser/Thr protein kinase)
VQLVERLNPGVVVDSALAPLICTGILGEPPYLVEVRHQLERWTARTGLSASAAADLVLSSYEALANAAEHAYPSGPGPVDLVAARTTDGRVLVTVSDRGRWRPPPADPGFRGRGLPMMKALAHHVQVRQGPQGTTVHMEWTLPVIGRDIGPAQHE